MYLPITELCCRLILTGIASSFRFKFTTFGAFPFSKTFAVVQNSQSIAGNYNLTDITLDQLQAQEKEVVVSNEDLTVKVIPLVVPPTDTMPQQQHITETVKEIYTVQKEYV
ncbi:MAG TPA: hypothetical protein PKU82_08810, partial [Bacteroidia bacterium]|nr:hypothetical protein [Bacteroidia bacterium]